MQPLEIHADKFIPKFIEERNISAKDVSIIKNCMSNIRVFGTPIKYGFHYRDTINVFQITNAEQIEFDDPEERYIGIVESNGKKLRKLLLTQAGLYRVLYSADNNIGKLMRRCITYIFNQLLLDHHVSRKNVSDHINKEHPELISNVIKDMQTTIDILYKQREDEKRSRTILETQLDQSMNLLENIEDENFALNVQNTYLQNKCRELETTSHKIREEADKDKILIESSVMKNVLAKHGKKIYVYLEPSNKKFSSDVYDYTEYDEYNTPCDIFCIFSISNKKLNTKKKIIVKTYFVTENKALFKEMQDTLADRYSVAEKKYLCTMDDIDIVYNELIV